MLEHLGRIFERVSIRTEETSPWKRIKILHELKTAMQAFGEVSDIWLHLFATRIESLFEPAPSLADLKEFVEEFESIRQESFGSTEFTVKEVGRQQFYKNCGHKNEELFAEGFEITKGNTRLHGRNGLAVLLSSSAKLIIVPSWRLSRRAFTAKLNKAKRVVSTLKIGRSSCVMRTSAQFWVGRRWV
mmetsp:Transcript_148869/g.478233  ORF Transcript_148869/g.478233 Transcript_148869/m.478233 type:complete len:187 (-) Transcript_148869:388-948(-)